MKPTNLKDFFVPSNLLFLLGILFMLVLAVLLGLSLTIGREYLEDSWGITFPTLLSLNWWMLLAGLFLGILLLYFLKLRRQAASVSSTYLWKKSIEDIHVNALMQWLKKNILLLLQLFALLAVAFALAAPTTHSEARGRHIIFMIDNSASMSSTDIEPTRLEEAKKKVLERIEGLAPTDQAMVVAFNEDAQIYQSYTNRKVELKAAIARIQQSYKATRLAAAMDLAEGQANPRRSAEEGMIELAGSGSMARSMGNPEGIQTDVLIYSDGNFPDIEEFTLGKIRPVFIPIGTDQANAGISWLSIKRHEEKPDFYELSVRVQNFTEKPLPDSVSIEVETMAFNEKLDVQVKKVVLSEMRKSASETGGEKSDPNKIKGAKFVPGTTIPDPILFFNVKDPGHGYVRVRLKDAKTGSDWKDAFPADNIAYAAISPVRKARILQIGPVNELLNAYFAASTTKQRVNLMTLPAADFEKNSNYQSAINSEEFDLVIFDRVYPSKKENMPQANCFFIGACPPWEGGTWDDLPRLSKLFVKEFRSGHAFFNGIETLQGMTIEEGRALPVAARPVRSSPLMESQREPLLWSFGRDRYTDLVMTFPLVLGANGDVWNTNWPKQPPGTLPLFLDNVLIQLGRYKDTENSTRPGVPKVIVPATAVKETEVQLADPVKGTAQKVTRGSGQELVYSATERPGIYEANVGERQPYRFAVNLFDSNESQVQVRDKIQIGYENIAGTKENIKVRRELWQWFAGLALLVCLLEWVLYLRRVAV